MPEDGPCIFTGKTAIYFGDEEFFDDGKGHTLLQNQPLAICDKTAGDLASLGRTDIFISESTLLIRSRITDTMIISHAQDIMKSIDCHMNFQSIYGRTAINAKKLHQNKFNNKPS